MQYDKLLKESQAQLRLTPQDGVSTDPWLERLQYYEAISQLIVVQQNYNKQLETLFQV